MFGRRPGRSADGMIAVDQHEWEAEVASTNTAMVGRSKNAAIGSPHGSHKSAQLHATRPTANVLGPASDAAEAVRSSRGGEDSNTAKVAQEAKAVQEHDAIKKHESQNDAEVNDSLNEPPPAQVAQVGSLTERSLWSPWSSWSRRRRRCRLQSRIDSDGASGGGPGRVSSDLNGPGLNGPGHSGSASVGHADIGSSRE